MGKTISGIAMSCLLLGACAANGGGGSRDAGRDAGGGDVDAGPMEDGGAWREDAGVRDGGLPGMDAGGEDAGVDGGGLDAGELDAGADAGADDAGAMEDAGTDAGAMEDAGTDAGGGTPSVTIDGTIGATEWAGVPVAMNGEPTGWAGNELRTLRAFTDGTWLYVGIEGIVEGEAGAEVNGIVLYVDADLADATVGVADLTTLTDGAGALDDAISAGYLTPAGFLTDYAWGTRGMSEQVDGFDERIGWRDVASDVADFAWINGSEAPAVCGTEACETRIRLSALGAASGDTVAMFARITNNDGTAFDNGQTLPEDEPLMPQSVSELYTVVVP